PPPGGGRSARASGSGGGDSVSTNSVLPLALAPPSPHPALPSAAENRSLPSPCRGGRPDAAPPVAPSEIAAFPRVTDLLANDDLIEPSPAPQARAGDLTR